MIVTYFIYYLNIETTHAMSINYKHIHIHKLRFFLLYRLCFDKDDSLT